MVYCVREDISVDPLLCCCQMTTPIQNPSSDLYGDKCVFCGMSGDADKNPNPVSIAHLLKNKADCEEASTVFYSPLLLESLLID